MSQNDAKLVPLRIRLPYGSEDEFVEKYGSNVARGGVFIATRALKAEGTLIAFEFVLADGGRVLRGEGLVVKTQVDEGGSRSGMTVRFTKLDARSKALIDRVIAFRNGFQAAPPPDDSGIVTGEHPAVGVAAPPAEPEAAPSAPGETFQQNVSAPESPPPAAVEASGTFHPQISEPVSEKPLAAEPPAEPFHRQVSDPVPAEPLSGEPPGGTFHRETAPPVTEASAEVLHEEAGARTIADAEARARRRSFLTAPEPTARKSDASWVLGIDLGTTNSRAAVFRNGRAELIPISGDAWALPSIVARSPEGSLLVGEAARARMTTSPSDAVFGAKRLLGRRARSAKVQELAGHFPFVIAPDENGDAGVRLGEAVHSLPSLYARILQTLAQAAREHLHADVNKAVLCVPAYFNDHQRSAMREAGRLAGLEVARIFNEPSAVALAFGYGRGLARKRVLVYDLGGGTFDATVVELTGDDLEVVATGGDNFLGGMDFDRGLADELARRHAGRTSATFERTGAPAQRLLEAAEAAKISLSERDACDVRIAELNLRDQVTRAQLEEVTAPLVERTVALTQSVLDSEKISAAGLDEILLVGGQSRAPLVRRRIHELLGKPLRTDVDAQAAVALGAAILGHALQEAEKGRRGVTLSEVLSAPIGLGVRGGKIRRVLERNTRLPADKTITLPVREGQPLGLAVYQGSADRAEDNEYLGCLNALGDKGGELSLRFTVGADGILGLTAVGPSGRAKEIALATADAPDEVRQALLEQSPLPGEPDAEPSGLFRGIRRLLKRS